MTVLSQADYDQQFKRFVAAMEHVPGIKDCRRIGEVAAPGISDLDMIIIFGDEFDAMAATHAVTEVQQKSVIELDVKFVPIDLESRIPWLLPGINLEGYPIPDRNARRELAYVYLLLLLPEKLRRLCLLQARCRFSELGLRHIYSLRYSLEQLVLLGALDAHPVANLVTSIQGLRKDWLGGSVMVEQLRQLARETEKLLRTGLKSLSFPHHDAARKQERCSVLLDWCSLLVMGDEEGVDFSILPMARWLPENQDYLAPFVLHLPSAWADVLSYFYAHPQLQPHLPQVKGELPTPKVRSAVISELVDIYARLQEAHRRHGLERGAILRPLSEKRKPLILRAYKQCCGRLYHRHAYYGVERGAR
jgi:hypothetical protein